MLRDDVGIELLVQTVKEGRMDPWDLDITQVTDRYLAKIDIMDHRNLSVSGRLFFYASVLLRLKAQYTAEGFLSLTAADGDDFEELAGEDTDIDPLLGEDLDTGEDPDQLHLPGMVVYPRPAGERKRGLSLKDLIGALQRCEELERRRERGRIVRARQARRQEEVVGTAHDDDIGGDIDRLRNRVGTDRVPFERLLCENLSPTTAYMALLFLASNDEVKLHQRHFYRDLSITRSREFRDESKPPAGNGEKAEDRQFQRARGLQG